MTPLELVLSRGRQVDVYPEAEFVRNVHGPGPFEELHAAREHAADGIAERRLVVRELWIPKFGAETSTWTPSAISCSSRYSPDADERFTR